MNILSREMSLISLLSFISSKLTSLPGKLSSSTGLFFRIRFFLFSQWRSIMHLFHYKTLIFMNRTLISCFILPFMWPLMHSFNIRRKDSVSRLLLEIFHVIINLWVIKTLSFKIIFKHLILLFELVKFCDQFEDFIFSCAIFLNKEGNISP